MVPTATLAASIVTNQNHPNTSPTSPTPTYAAGWQFAEQFTASGGDGPYTYSLGTNAPVGMTINATTGLVTWVPMPGTAAGAYSFDVSVADTHGVTVGSASDSVSVAAQQPYSDSHPSLTVSGANGALSNGTTVQVGQGGVLNFTLTGTDADLSNGLGNDLLTFSTSAPALTGTGAQTLTNPPNGYAYDSSAPTSVSENYSYTVSSSMAEGTYPLVLTVKDAERRHVHEDLNVQVVSTLTPPTFNSTTLPTAYLGTTWSGPVAAQPAAAGDSLRYALLATGPGIDASIDPTSGVITWKVPADFAATSAAFTVQTTEIDRVSGAALGSTQQNFTAAVMAVTVEQPPTFSAAGALPTAPSGATWTTTVAAQPYFYADSIQYSIVSEPAGVSAAIDPNTGVITWSVPAGFSPVPQTVQLTVGATEVSASGQTLNNSTAQEVLSVVVYSAPAITQPPGGGTNPTGITSVLNPTSTGSGTTTVPLPITFAPAIESELVTGIYAIDTGYGAQPLGTGIGTGSGDSFTLTALPSTGGGQQPSALPGGSTSAAGGGPSFSDADIGGELLPDVRRVLGDTGLFGTQLSPDGGNGGTTAPPTWMPVIPTPDLLPVEPFIEKNKSDSGRQEPTEPTGSYLNPEAQQAWQQLADDRQPVDAGGPASPAAVDRALEDMLDEAIAATARMVALL